MPNQFYSHVKTDRIINNLPSTHTYCQLDRKSHVDLSHLTLGSTLADLPTHSFQVHPTTLARTVATEFTKQPGLSGVIVMDNAQILGNVSRHKFMERIGRPYGADVYLTRPIGIMLESLETEYILLPSSCGIHAATQVALNRPVEMVYDPIIVEFPDLQDKRFRLLDVYDLLLAQSNLLNLANDTIHLRAKELEQLNADKDKFFSIVAHDLKGPFQPLLGLSELLATATETFSPTDIQEMSQGIHHSAKNVYSLLENLLEWSRLHQGRMPFQPVHLNLHEMTQQVVDLLTSNAINKGIALQNSVPMGIMVRADECMLNTIIRNLVNNALKFTPAGGQVKVECHFSDISGLVEIAVIDTGVGMPDKIKENLFKIDQQVTTIGTAQEKGTGLGLLICKEMVEKHGGQIWVESELGEGTAMKFTVPLLAVIAEPFPPLKQRGEEGQLQTNFYEPNLVTLPPEKMTTLLDLALMGNMEEIKVWASGLEELGEQYLPLAYKLKKLAKGFEDEAILDLVNQFICLN